MAREPALRHTDDHLRSVLEDLRGRTPADPAVAEALDMGLVRRDAERPADVVHLTPEGRRFLQG